MNYKFKHINSFHIINENEYNATDLVDCLESLRKVKNKLPMRMVIEWFNESNIDYFNMSDLEMIIKYIEENSSSDIEPLEDF